MAFRTNAVPKIPRLTELDVPAWIFFRNIKAPTSDIETLTNSYVTLRILIVILLCGIRVVGLRIRIGGILNTSHASNTGRGGGCVEALKASLCRYGR
jgi:hypothetical protein